MVMLEDLELEPYEPTSIRGVRRSMRFMLADTAGSDRYGGHAVEHDTINDLWSIVSWGDEFYVIRPWNKDEDENKWADLFTLQCWLLPLELSTGGKS